MFGIHDIWLFIAAGLLLNVTPGPDTAFIVGRSLQGGWRSGCAAALGISTGCLLHVFAAAIGLSALLAASATAFLILKLIGGAYLIYMGVRMIFARSHEDTRPAHQALPAQANHQVPPQESRQVFWQVFWQGALTNALNPKVALFFLAFLPQFVDAASPDKAYAFIALGLLFIFNGTVWDLGVAAIAASTATRLRTSAVAMRWINRAIGSMFIYLGIRVALTDAR
jgi:threonine/homoserine/homoserine lactone efflux protein